MNRPLPFSQLLLLFIAFRLAALLLYLPGGLIAPMEMPYPAFDFLPAGEPWLRALSGGLFLLPFEIGTLYGIARLMQQAGQKGESNWRALWWAVSPLSLWGYLTGWSPVVVCGLVWGLALLGNFRIGGRRAWVMVALTIGAATLIEGPKAEYTAVLLPFVILLSADPAPVSILFAVGALLAGPFASAIGVEGTTATLLTCLYYVTFAPALVEWALMMFPLLGWHIWRPRLLGAASVVAVLLGVVTLFMALPQDLRAARLETSPLTPALTEMEAAPTGWFLTDSADLWEQAVGLGKGTVETRVVSARNAETVRATLQTSATPIWILQSNREGSGALLDTVTAGFFQGDVTPLEDGTILRRYASDAPNATSETVPLNAVFTDGVTLENARLPREVRAGTLLPLELIWKGDLGTAKLFLHVLDANGTLVAQRDTLPGASPDRHAITIPANLPPGTYTIRAGRYHPDTLERVPLSQGNDSIVLGTVMVVP